MNVMQPYPEYRNTKDSLPKISVVILTYNRCNLLLQTVQSVKEQTHPPHEIIVVVDGSTDDTAATIRAHYPDVTLFEQPNLGEGVARNSGVAIATGEWIAFLDDDDLWHRDKLKIVADYIYSQPECKALHHLMWYFCDEENGPKEVLGIRRDFVAKTLEECHVAATSCSTPLNLDRGPYRPLGNFNRLLHKSNASVMSSAVVRREIVIRSGGFPPAQAVNADWTMTLNVARLCEWHTIPQRLGFYRFHANQVSSGNPFQGLFSLAVSVNAWSTGRPLPHRLENHLISPELEKYGPNYRKVVQGCFWYALRQRRFKIAGHVRALGKLLLPRWFDNIYVLIPPQITWRWERYVLGMHK